MYIYADNAASAPLRKSALEAMLPYLTEYCGNSSALHRAGEALRDAEERAKTAIAAALGCRKARVILTSGGCEANCQAIFSAAALGEKTGRKHIVSTGFEHSSVKEALAFLAEHGFSVTLVNPDSDGFIHTEDIKKALRHDTCLVSVMCANNEVGTVQPVKEIGTLCRENGIIFHTDAVQAAGHIHINTDEICADLLTVSAHKFGGPKGTGALIINNAAIAPLPLIFGGKTQDGARGGTVDTAGAVGMAAALTEACGSIEKKNERLYKARLTLIDGLLKIPGAVLNGSEENSLPGIVNVSFSRIEGERLVLLLDTKGIACSSGSACSGGNAPSESLKAMGRSDEEARQPVRLSLGENITDEEIGYIINTVSECVRLLRSTGTEL